MKYVILRYAVDPENEGKHRAMKVCETQDEAWAWIAKQEGEYYGPHCYYFVELEECYSPT